MQNEALYDDSLELVFSDGETSYYGIKIPKRIIRALYKRLFKEQKNGILKKWCFDEEVTELYCNTISLKVFNKNFIKGEITT